MAKKQYYKVVNTKIGHYGFYYKVGLNVDPFPRPLEYIPSCGFGALYFTDAENLSSFALTGDSIAWVTPASKVKADGVKWKAHKLNVTKILPFKKALPLIPGLCPNDYSSFGVKLTPKQVIQSEQFSLEDKLDWLMDYGESPLALILANKGDKKFMKLVKEREFEFDEGDVRKLLDNDLPDLINQDTLRALAWDFKYHKKSKKLMITLIQRFPELVINALADI